MKRVLALVMMVWIIAIGWNALNDDSSYEDTYEETSYAAAESEEDESEETTTVSSESPYTSWSASGTTVGQWMALSSDEKAEVVIDGTAQLRADGYSVLVSEEWFVDMLLSLAGSEYGDQMSVYEAMLTGGKMGNAVE